MANDRGGFDTRGQLFDLLLEKVDSDPYPSATMMDLIEQIAEPEEIPVYAAVLMKKISADTYPSVPLMRRLVELTS